MGGCPARCTQNFRTANKHVVKFRKRVHAAWNDEEDSGASELEDDEDVWDHKCDKKNGQPKSLVITPLSVGDVVMSKVTGKRGTVVSVDKDGDPEIRFKGEEESFLCNGQNFEIIDTGITSKPAPSDLKNVKRRKRGKREKQRHEALDSESDTDRSPSPDRQLTHPSVGASIGGSAKISERMADDLHRFRKTALCLLTHPADKTDDGALLNAEEIIVELVAVSLSNYDALLHPVGEALAQKTKMQMWDSQRSRLRAPDLPHALVQCLFRNRVLEGFNDGVPLSREARDRARLSVADVELLHVVLAAHLGALLAYWEHLGLDKVDASRLNTDTITLELANPDCLAGRTLRLPASMHAATYTAPALVEEWPRLELLRRRAATRGRITKQVESAMFTAAAVAEQAVAAWEAVDGIVFRNTILEKLVGSRAPLLHHTAANGCRINDDEMFQLVLEAESNMETFLIECSSNPQSNWFKLRAANGGSSSSTGSNDYGIEDDDVSEDTESFTASPSETRGLDLDSPTWEPYVAFADTVDVDPPSPKLTSATALPARNLDEPTGIRRRFPPQDI